jgi:polyisoprenoid-binding protein YceI
MKLLLLLAPLGTLAAVEAASAQSSSPAGSGGGERLRYVVAPTGNEARYRVREQLVGKDLPNDAIGATQDVTGRIVVGPDGRVLRDSSRIVVKVASLKSDQSRRDNFLRRRTLESEKFPDVALVPTAIQGLLSPIPAGQSRTFALAGELTVHGVTRPTTWNVTARADGSAVVGTATTAFTFKDFALDQPRVPIVLSVADTIRLEYDFRFVPDTVR